MGIQQNVSAGSDRAWLLSSEGKWNLFNYKLIFNTFSKPVLNLPSRPLGRGQLPIDLKTSRRRREAKRDSRIFKSVSHQKSSYRYVLTWHFHLKLMENATKLVLRSSSLQILNQIKWWVTVCLSWCQSMRAPSPQRLGLRWMVWCSSPASLLFTPAPLLSSIATQPPTPSGWSNASMGYSTLLRKGGLGCSMSALSHKVNKYIEIKIKDQIGHFIFCPTLQWNTTVKNN